MIKGTEITNVPQVLVKTTKVCHTGRLPLGRKGFDTLLLSLAEFIGYRNETT